MRQGKRPTVKQKRFLKEHNLNPDNWLIISDDKFKVKAVHRDTKNIKEISKVAK